MSSVRFTVALALLVPCFALAWGLAVPNVLTPLSYVLFGGLLTALVAVALITYRNTQATITVAHILREADIASSPATPRVR